MPLPIIACGYEINLDDVKQHLKRAFVGAVAGSTSQIGLYFGSASVGAPIIKTDTEIREWYANHQSECTLRLTEIYFRGIVFGKFIDADGVEFLGVILNHKGEPVMEAKANIASFTKLTIKPHDIKAKPYLFTVKPVACEDRCDVAWCTTCRARKMMNECTIVDGEEVFKYTEDEVKELMKE